MSTWCIEADLYHSMAKLGEHEVKNITYAGVKDSIESEVVISNFSTGLKVIAHLDQPWLVLSCVLANHAPPANRPLNG